ncbi:MAG TPA: hypothetical protein VMB18_14865 [Terriglobales bacterium]|nr:hypothetical protein [Terriglobales bacterium]
MPEVFHESPQGFWRPPAIHPETAVAALPAATCPGCSSEFLAGSQFCHVCGTSRGPKTSPVEHGWRRVVETLRFLEALEFHSVKEWFGLSTASLAAFLLGVGCVFAALTVGLLYSVQNFADFQAIQLWRIEWLLAAVAAFVAGILLKKAGETEKK